jgi:hypothetical protein
MNLSNLTRSNKETRRTNVVRWQSVALPAEHGSWSLVLEPIFLGLLVAPTVAGFFLALAAFCAFLLHQPLKVFWADNRRGRLFARTHLAVRFVALFTLLTAAFLLAVVGLVGLRPLLPLLLALPLLIIFAVFDQRPGRHWQAELTAPTAFAAVSATIALAAGWSFPAAFALWGVMIARAVPAVLYVRSRLRLVKGQPPQSKRAITAHLLALLGMLLLVWRELLPLTAILAMLILLLRASFGLSRYRHEVTTKRLGFTEMGFGLITIIVIAIGYWM